MGDSLRPGGKTGRRHTALPEGGGPAFRARSRLHCRDGEVVLCVVNRHMEESVTTEIISQEGSFKGEFRVYEVNGPDIKTMNDFGSEPVKTVQKENVRVRGDRFTYTFPPHSFTLLKGTIE